MFSWGRFLSSGVESGSKFGSTWPWSAGKSAHTAGKIERPQNRPEGPSKRTYRVEVSQPPQNPLKTILWPLEFYDVSYDFTTFESRLLPTVKGQTQFSLSRTAKLAHLV